MSKKFSTFLVLMMMWSSVYSDSVISIEMQYGFYVGDLFEVEKTTGNIKPVIILPSIPGSIFGTPSEPILYTKQANSNNRIVIELPKNIDELAQPFEAEGLSILPKGARLLRLGTFHVDPSNPEILRGGGFVDVESSNLLILVYVAQSTKIEGVLALDNVTFDHDIELEKPGWHWIEFSKITRNHYTLKTRSGDQADIEFAVLLENTNEI